MYDDPSVIFIKHTTKLSRKLVWYFQYTLHFSAFVSFLLYDLLEQMMFKITKFIADWAKTAAEILQTLF